MIFKSFETQAGFFFASEREREREREKEIKDEDETMYGDEIKEGGCQHIPEEGLRKKW